MTDSQPIDLYIQSVDAEAKAVVCSREQSGFAALFEARYKAWRKANSDALAQGEAVARERNMLGEGRRSVKAFARTNAAILEILPDDDRQRRCDELLESFLTKEQR